MNKKSFILIFYILSCTLPANTQNQKQVLLRDGIILRGAAGRLIGPDSNDSWFFELSSPINDEDVVAEVGTKLELLPSSSLEMMIADSKTHLPALYQLWNAKVTKYKGNNYIFPSIFIRVSPPDKTQPPENENIEKQKPEQSTSPDESLLDSNSVDMNDTLELPPEVIRRMNEARQNFVRTGQRIPDSNIVTIDTIQQELEKKRQSNPDTILLDRSAILVKHRDRELEFEFDSLGRNLNSTSFRLLPCEVLEQTEARQSASPEPLRFKISGVVTKYKGNKYLLLYKATQLYSHGNFPG
jgi:hypothetical protein